MQFSEFDPARYDHWLLIAAFVAIALCGLSLSWQWKKERKQQQAKAKLVHRLMREIHYLPAADRASTHEHLF